MAESESILSQETTEPVIEDTSGGTWRESLSEGLRNAGALRDIPDIETLAKAYTDAQSYVGGSIRIPTPDSTEETWKDFVEKIGTVEGVGFVPTSESEDWEWDNHFNTLGRPETVEDYKIERPEYALENPDAEAGLLAKAHELGLNSKQASGLVNWMNDGLVNMGRQGEVSQEQAVSALQTEWGQAFDAKINDAKNAVTAYGGDDLVNELNASGLGNNVALVKAFAEIGKGLSENPAMNMGDQKNARQTPAEAREQINEIVANPDHPYNDDGHPNHRYEVDRVSKLYQTVYGTGDEPDMFEQKFASAAG